MKNNNQRYGSALEHGRAHQKDHNNWSRRGFLRNLGLLGGTSMLLGKVPLNAVGASPLSNALRSLDNDRVLVLIRLKGGNDGLNTIIPIYDYDRYANLRPSIRLPENNLIRLTDEFSMNQNLSDLQPMWEEDAMKVINSVGYPDQNLSHFRSTDIWSSASDAETIDNSGWLGRYLGGLYPNFLENPPDVPPALQIGGLGSNVFNDLNLVNIGLSVADTQQLEEIAQNGQLYDLNNLPDCTYGEQLGFVRTIANSTFFYAETIAEAADKGRNEVDYPTGNPLASQLATVARLIKGRLGTKMYMVTLEGFDTHANQLNNHARLMRYIGEGVKAFYDDLDAGSWSDRVLSMTFSEFGRRPEQNASNGTDHGAAAPVLLFGGALNESRVQGENPDLRDLDQAGNLKFATDFRQIYATVLEEWLCVKASTVNEVMGYDFERLDLGFQCNAITSIDTIQGKPRPAHWVSSSMADGYTIHYRLPEAAEVHIEIFTVLGQSITAWHPGQQIKGDHQVEFSPSRQQIPAGQYFYQIKAGKYKMSGGLQVV
ncbi:MAG: DUF1501 domain-containing protein, partial [Bacteroidota bacterium]